MRPQTVAEETNSPAAILAFNFLASSESSFTLALKRSPVENESSSGYLLSNFPH